MQRDHWQREIARLDPEVDYAEIYRIMGAHEFPWDLTQSLGLALYRRFVVRPHRIDPARRLLLSDQRPNLPRWNT